MSVYEQLFPSILMKQNYCDSRLNESELNYLSILVLFPAYFMKLAFPTTKLHNPADTTQ